jgi:hypothetical protein
MPFDRFLIAPYSSGLRTDLRPWLIPDDAFEELINAYVFRGRVRKRFGSVLMGPGTGDEAPTSQLLSRLRINLGNTDGAGAASGTVPGTIFSVGQLFSIGTEIFTVTTAGAVQPMLKTGTTVTATYSTTNGAYNFVGAAATTPVYFYPALPVMGLANYEVGAINNQPLFGFDTQFVYQYFPSTGWQRSSSGISPFDPIFKGTDLDFFWTTNWRGTTADVTIFFVTNFNSSAGAPPATQDPMWYYDGTTWTIFTPYFLPAGGVPTSGPFVQTARIILPFKNRLILLNTIEYDGVSANQAFVNRCRYSFVGSPFAANAWYERGQTDSLGNVAAGGGFTDATTEEAIVSAEFIKDRLIVYFDRSTWELVYTGNQVEPFVWQKINTELGSESTFSTVPFDKVVLTIGNTGVHACNGSNVERIDNNIPNQVFEVQDKSTNTARVAGIRDYFTEMVYWTYNIESDTQNYPDRVLVYNYKNGSWAINIDSITCWGYYEQQLDTTWATANISWGEANFNWLSGVVQAQFRQVVAGNQEGYTFIISPDVSRNAPVLQITDMTLSTFSNFNLTIINHNLSEGDFIYIENAQGFSDFTPEIVQILDVVDLNNVLTNLSFSAYTGTYTGGGTAARVSNIQILTKQFNPYIKQGNDVTIGKVDFGIKKTVNGQITVDYYPSATNLSMVTAGQSSGSILGNNILETSPYDPIYYPLEQQQERLWHSIYFQSYGECIQLYFYLSFDQISNPFVAFEDFQLEGMILYTNPTGRLG